jgi:hypothetical protein
MNTVQIVNHFRTLENDKKELRDVLDLLSEKGYRGSKAYSILEKSWEEKQKEYNIFSRKEWVDE